MNWPHPYPILISTSKNVFGSKHTILDYILHHMAGLIMSYLCRVHIRHIFMNYQTLRNNREKKCVMVLYLIIS